jgi:hypothetical protein
MVWGERHWNGIGNRKDQHLVVVIPGTDPVSRGSIYEWTYTCDFVRGVSTIDLTRCTRRGYGRKTPKYRGGFARRAHPFACHTDNPADLFRKSGLYCAVHDHETTAQ